MTARIALAAVALFASVSAAEIPPPPDDVSAAYDKALTDLRAGKDRKEIADRLKPVVEKNPKSYYFKLANEFLTDLTESAKNPPKPDAEPEKRLADTKIGFGTLTVADSWDSLLKDFIKKEPTDPASQLLVKGRPAIALLIPLLSDQSPARCGALMYWSGWPAPQLRVCDVALAIIEYHSKCRFHHDTVLSQHPKDFREKVAKRVADWWAECKDKSVAAGVRAQLPHAASYPQTVEMAKTLAKLGDAQKEDKEFALNTLRDMVKQYPRSHVAAYVANALAELGDTSAVDIFHDEWKSWLGRPGLMHDSGIAFYLCKHGKRREWELLHAISQQEADEDMQPGTRLWANVLNAPQAATNPLAIPILGVALSQNPSRVNPSYSPAEKAIELLQKQTGKDFGYKRGCTAEERATAIKAAQKWWDDEGKAKYTFDFIEKNMKPAKP